MYLLSMYYCYVFVVATYQQSKELNTEHIPKFYYIRPDCLILEQWPEDIELSPTGTEVVVDTVCAAAVLRGAHVFAPGIMGLATSKRFILVCCQKSCLIIFFMTGLTACFINQAVGSICQIITLEVGIWSVCHTETP